MEFDRELTKAELKKVYEWSRDGASQKSIAGRLGISISTFERMLKHRDAVREGMERGLAELEGEAVAVLKELAIVKKDPAMLRFLLMAKFKYRINDEVHLHAHAHASPIEKKSDEELIAGIDDMYQTMKRIQAARDVTPNDGQEDE